jgi:hypothetical protein
VRGMPARLLKCKKKQIWTLWKVSLWGKKCNTPLQRRVQNKCRAIQKIIKPKKKP